MKRGRNSNPPAGMIDRLRRPHLNRFHHPGDRERIRRIENRMPVVGQEYPGTQQEAVFLAASWITPPKQANSEAVRIPRQGKTRQVIKNQLSDTTKRRSRDMAPSICLKPVTATRHFRMSSIPYGVPQSNFSRRKTTLRYAASHPATGGTSSQKR